MSDSEQVDVEGEYVTDTDDAVRIRTFVGATREVWVPKSLIEEFKGAPSWDEFKEGDALELRIPEWKATRAGLI